MKTYHTSIVQKVRRKSQEGQVDKEIRLRLAIQAYEDALGAVSYRRIALEYGVNRAIMQARMASCRSLEDMHKDQQLLTPAEENSIVDSIERTHSQGWPYRVSQVRHLALEILKKRSLVLPVLGINWVSKFLARHPSLQSKFSIPKDLDRIVAENPDVMTKWFDLFSAQVRQYGIEEEDIYNMDEKGYAMGLIGKARVIVSKYEWVAYMMQDGNKEWVSLIECVAMNDDMLGPQIILKGKLRLKEWLRYLRSPNMNITVLETGWTNNEIGLKYVKTVFEPQSRTRLKIENKYRLWFLDSHSSHITREVILFCESQKIIFLCLPAHSTHILQPLDVSIFGPMAAMYKQTLEEKPKPGVGYFIDKIDFLKYYQDAREAVIRPALIQSAFQKSRYRPFDHTFFLKNLLCA